MGQRRRHAPAVGQGRVALDRRGRSEVARLARRDRRRRARSLPALQDIAAGVRRDGFTHALLLGMGGSSLCPEVAGPHLRTRSPARRTARARLDDPVAGRRASRGRVDLDRTLVIVASKSGQHARAERLSSSTSSTASQAVRGPAEAARRFVAITDPGSKLQKVGRRRAGFRHIVSGEPTIGGRYSALSPFGLVPAAVMGVDVARLPRRDGADGRRVSRLGRRPRQPRRRRSGCCSARPRSPAATSSRSSPRPASSGLGAWLEQLVAESTGKNGQSIIPVDLEALAPPERVRRRSRLRLPAARHRARRGAGCRRRRARSGRRRSSCASTWRDPLRHRPGVLPLGDRHRRRVARHAPQPVRSAGRRGEQDRDEGAHRAPTSATAACRRRRRP